MTIDKVAVIGSGLMGHGIAQVAASMWGPLVKHFLGCI